jgi:hypothetical protein
VSRGVDVRAEGGFAVWWPREGYEVVGVVVAEWPEEILRLVRRSGDGSGTTREHVNSAHADVNGDADVMDGGVRPEPTGSVKLRGKYLLLKVEKAQRGNRNNMLHWAACRFGEMIGEGKIKREIAEQLLEGACRLNRLWMDDPREVRATIKSGLDQGIQAWMAWIGAGNRDVLPISAASNLNAAFSAVSAAIRSNSKSSASAASAPAISAEKRRQ